MPRKAAAPLRIAPLQHVIAVPITDPAEQAALDKLRKRAKRKQGWKREKANRSGASDAPDSAGKRRGEA
jgi:hypothetical protein